MPLKSAKTRFCLSLLSEFALNFALHFVSVSHVRLPNSLLLFKNIWTVSGTDLQIRRIIRILMPAHDLDIFNGPVTVKSGVVIHCLSQSLCT